jgi:glutaredoxin
MRPIKILLTTGLAICLVFTLFTSAIAQSGPEDDPSIVITFFWREGCSYCAKEKPFLEELTERFPQIDLQEFDVTASQQNLNYYLGMGDAVGYETGGVPVTVIGDRFWIGYSDGVGREIESVIGECLNSGCENTSELFDIQFSDFEQPEEEVIVEQPTAAEEPVVVTPEVVEPDETEQSSSFPFWIVVIALVIVLGIVLVLFGRDSEKKTKKVKRH